MRAAEQLAEVEAVLVAVEPDMANREDLQNVRPVLDEHAGVESHVGGQATIVVDTRLHHVLAELAFPSETQLRDHAFVIPLRSVVRHLAASRSGFHLQLDIPGPLWVLRLDALRELEPHGVVVSIADNVRHDRFVGSHCGCSFVCSARWKCP